MRVLYGCSFSLSGSGGKNRATRQKLEALRGLVGRLTVIAPNSTGDMLSRMYAPISVEARLVRAVLHRPRRYQVLVTRGRAGFLAGPLFRAMGGVTVREIHADLFEELTLLNKGSVITLLLQLVEWIMQREDKASDLRIFNNPRLLRWYQAKGIGKGHDIAVYNGGDPSGRSEADPADVRRRFELPEDRKLLVFVGSAAIWHGVDRLVELQRLFEEHGDPVQIVCAGGLIPSEVDPERKLVNIAPLDERGCADVIRAADVCLLPVRDVRVSPGSPLKLYDYIVNQATVMTQQGLPGYADEVRRWEVGACTNFEVPEIARRDLLELLANEDKAQPRAGYDAVLQGVSWSARMALWLDAIQGLEQADSLEARRRRLPGALGRVSLR